MYSLKLKGKKSKIYFLPSTDSAALFGIFTSNADFLPRRAK
jgi:hypothetical protein